MIGSINIRIDQAEERILELKNQFFKSTEPDKGEKTNKKKNETSKKFRTI